MHGPSYPKETPDQWPPIAEDLSGWGGACNQSINNGCSLGEQHNLMRHTHTHTSPFIWLPPPFCLLLKLHMDPFFLSFSCRLSFCWALSSSTVSALLCHSMPSPPLPSSPSIPPPHPHLLNSRGTGHTKARNAAGLEWRRKVEKMMMDAELRQLGVRDRQIDGARTGWTLVSDWPIVSTVQDWDQQHKWSCSQIDNNMTAGLMNYKFLWS